MKKTVWKYPLAVADEQTIEVPFGPQFLCVQNQDGRPCLWALVDPDSGKGKRRIITMGTGHVRNDVMVRDYIGTYQLQGGGLVFHVFDGGIAE